MQAVLVMFRADGQRRSFSVTRDMTVIGRREDCDLRIPLHDVSRKHARLVRDGDSLRLEDLGSSNGTCLNGQRLQAEAILNPGDSIQVGPVVFVLQVDSYPADEDLNPVMVDLNAARAAAAAPPPPPEPPADEFAQPSYDEGAELEPLSMESAEDLSPLAMAAGGDDDIDALPSLDELDEPAEAPPARGKPGKAPPAPPKPPVMEAGEDELAPLALDDEPLQLDDAPIALDDAPIALDEAPAESEAGADPISLHHDLHHGQEAEAPAELAEEPLNDEMPLSLEEEAPLGEGEADHLISADEFEAAPAAKAPFAGMELPEPIRGSADLNLDPIPLDDDIVIARAQPVSAMPKAPAPAAPPAPPAPPVMAAPVAAAHEPLELDELEPLALDEAPAAEAELGSVYHGDENLAEDAELDHLVASDEPVAEAQSPESHEAAPAHDELELLDFAEEPTAEPEHAEAAAEPLELDSLELSEAPAAEVAAAPAPAAIDEAGELDELESFDFAEEPAASSEAPAPSHAAPMETLDELPLAGDEGLIHGEAATPAEHDELGTLSLLDDGHPAPHHDEDLGLLANLEEDSLELVSEDEPLKLDLGNDAHQHRPHA